jgi:hypothetical protein
MNKRNIRDYNNEELISLKKHYAAIESLNSILISELIDEIVRLREYEWKYNDLDK